MLRAVVWVFLVLLGLITLGREGVARCCGPMFTVLLLGSWEAVLVATTPYP